MSLSQLSLHPFHSLPGPDGMDQCILHARHDAAHAAVTVEMEVLSDRYQCFSGEVFLSRAWRNSVKACGFDPRPTVHDLRHCWKTNAMHSGIHPAIADMIVGHGKRKKDVQSLYLSISDADLLEAIDKMEFNHGGLRFG